MIQFVRIGVIIFLNIFCLNTAEASSKYLIYTKRLPDDLRFMPTLANGHLGFTVFGDSIFMNGVYNGQAGDSRRARIPNWINLNANTSAVTINSVRYTLNVRDGFFKWYQDTDQDELEITQRIYAHRYFNRAIIYDLNVRRKRSKDPITITIQQKPGKKTTDFNFSTIHDYRLPNATILRGVTKLVENLDFQHEFRTIYIVLSENLSEGKVINMSANQKWFSYRFIMTIDEDINGAIDEMLKVRSNEGRDVFHLHKSEWKNFWDSFNINIIGNIELSKTINAAIFYLANCLPSTNTNQRNNHFYGLSPTGLGRGNLDSDYEGHNFWDTEIWMLPVVTQLKTNWSKNLFKYRLQHFNAAIYNANKTGYKGARFPWESAFTGTEVVNPCCPEIAKQEIHISADISHAAMQFYYTTGDQEWLCQEGIPLLTGIAAFLASRVEMDHSTKKYHIKHVMGPDEYHSNVTDNVYTNVVTQYALKNAYNTLNICNPDNYSKEWLTIADNLEILYDPKMDYHPQHKGYNTGEKIKQADVILLGYPLQLPMKLSTRINDLKIYENVTSDTGPAMTWTMFAINYLDVNNKTKADEFFLKGYQSYVQPEFKVWSEVAISTNVLGAANFLTGIGGFLQSIIMGYAGIHFNNSDFSMEIRRPQSLPDSNGFEVNGIKFCGATFSIKTRKGGKSTLICTSTGTVLLQLIADNKKFQLHKGFQYEFKKSGIRILKSTNGLI